MDTAGLLVWLWGFSLSSEFDSFKSLALLSPLKTLLEEWSEWTCFDENSESDCTLFIDRMSSLSISAFSNEREPIKNNLVVELC